MTVDGTDCRIPEMGRDWYSQNFKKSAAHYEVACSILGQYICWVSGPHQPGLKNDLEIFRGGLLTYLEDYERVEADDGYIGEAPMYVSCPSMISMEAERKKMANRCTSRQETINKRFKQWEILNVPFRQMMSRITGMSLLLLLVQIQNGEPMFDCSEYQY